MLIMKYITVLILISFVGLAVFSVAIFDHRMNGSMDNCIGSQVDNTPCPTNLVASIFHHISVFQTLFNTFIPSLIIFLIFVSFDFWSQDLANPKLKFLYQKPKDFKLIKYRAKQKFISWLSLFENSPSF